MAPASNTTNPIITQRLQHPALDAAGVALWVQREDRVHPVTGGNKSRKLKYNLLQARAEGHRTLLTFGGAWSNHIAATAQAGRDAGFNTIGIIRGEAAHGLTPTLEFATGQGMQIAFIDRTSYRRKQDAGFIASLRAEYGDFYLLPEGGSNLAALRGCAEIIADTGTGFDLITTPVGTGATLAGMATALGEDQQVIGYAALENASFLNERVRSLLSAPGSASLENWRIETTYAFGGYAKSTPELIGFIKRFKRDHGIMLDAVYTAKMFYALFDQITRGDFDRGTRIVAVHTGGLQGNAGFPVLQNET